TEANGRPSHMLGRPFRYPLQRPRVPEASVRRFPAITLSRRRPTSTPAPAPTSRVPEVSVRRFPAVTLSRRHLPLTTAPAPTSRIPPSACGASLGVIAVGGLDPREHLAQFLTRGLDRVGLLI